MILKSFGKNNKNISYSVKNEICYYRNKFYSKIFTGHTDKVYSAKFSSDGKYILSCSDDNTIKLWDVSTNIDVYGKCIKTFIGHTNLVFSAEFSPDGRSILSCSDDNTIKLWDVSTNIDVYGKCIKTFIGHTDRINLAEFSPDGKYIVSCSQDTNLKLWDATHGADITFTSNVGNECIKTFTGHTDWVLLVKFSPDGKYIVSCSADKTIKLWNAVADTSIGNINCNIRVVDKCIKTFTGHTYSVYSAKFSPDGQYIVSCSADNTIKLWRIGANTDVGSECIKTFTGHTNWILQAEFLPDGKYIVSCSFDRTIKLWDAVCNTDTSIGIAGKCIKTFTGHTYTVYSAKFSPDGQYIVSYSADKTIKLWDAVCNTDTSINAGKCIKTFTGHAGSIYSAKFSPDGQTIVSCSADRTIRLLYI
jgi:WD40 repeat protein